MANRSHVLGTQGLRIIHDTAVRLVESKREQRRRRIEEASVRPTPGTSDMLATALNVRMVAGIDHRGNLRAVTVYDLLAMAPIHLKSQQ